MSKIPSSGGALPERILYNCGTMVGVCATLIGLVKVSEPHRGATHIDEYAGLTAVIFVLSAMAAYLSLRAPVRKSIHERLENAADLLFICGLTALAVIGLLFAYDLV